MKEKLALAEAFWYIQTRPMNHVSAKPPQLCPMSQCNKDLFFDPRTPWPDGLPAVAVNQVVLAGFSQSLVFNHQIDVTESDAIARLFRSLYFELSFVEMARLTDKARAFPWLPMESITQKFGWAFSENFFKVANRVLKTPAGFQEWAAERKLSQLDLTPLISPGKPELKFLFHDLISFNISRSLGVQALELGIELQQMGQSATALTIETLVPNTPRELSVAEAWVQALRSLRYPETHRREQETEAQMKELPWPGTTQARWTRQGDRAGIELKLFVSQPSDLKKYLQSLSIVQDLLEKETPGTQH
jgi:hypothetical protein